MVLLLAVRSPKAGSAVLGFPVSKLHDSKSMELRKLLALNVHAECRPPALGRLKDRP
jgi:hypothetical protein